VSGSIVLVNPQQIILYLELDAVLATSTDVDLEEDLTEL